MLSVTSGEEINYVNSMDEQDRLDSAIDVFDTISESAEDPFAGTDANTSVVTASPATRNTKPFSRGLGGLFPSLGSGQVSGDGLDAPELHDIKDLDLQAEDILELLDDEDLTRRRALSDQSPHLIDDPSTEPTAKTVVFTRDELLGLRLMFSLFDRTGNGFIEYEDLVAYAEETGDFMRIRDASLVLDILDIDGDGCIGLLDFIHFASRLQSLYQDGMLSISRPGDGEDGDGQDNS
jgi:hypothetical protein